MKYTIRIEDQEYEVEIKDLRARPIVVLVDGETFEVLPANGPGHSPALSTVSARPLENPTAAPRTTTPVPAAMSRSPVVVGAGIVRAPIPGVILEILVKPGEPVTIGQGLFIIEAMKMKNTIRSNRDGVIGEVLVAPGTTVNHNAQILSFQEG